MAILITGAAGAYLIKNLVDPGYNPVAAGRNKSNN